MSLEISTPLPPEIPSTSPATSEKILEENEAFDLPTPSEAYAERLAPLVPILPQKEDKTLDDLSLAHAIIAFMDQTKEYEVNEVSSFKDGTEKVTVKRIPRTPPAITEFCRRLGITKEELTELGKMYPGTVGKALQFATDIVQEYLVHYGLRGDYNSQFAIFVAKNFTDMKDATDVNVNSKMSFVQRLKLIEKEGDPLVDPKRVKVGEFKSAAKKVFLDPEELPSPEEISTPPLENA